jgi:pimeloyl-ACP methyl ester carboxylesterase
MSRRTFVGLALAAVALLGTATVVAYQRDMAAAKSRVISGGSIVETACGPVEYAEVGAGPAVLVLHGAGGGYDQGILLGNVLLDENHRLIAPSRFGYLGSPVLGDGTLEAQADAIVCLLDALGLERVAVVGISAGGPPAMQVALRHPQRVSTLVLASAVSYTTPGDAEVETVGLINRVIGWDPLYWLTGRIARGWMAELMGVPRALQARLSPVDAAWRDEILDSMLPMSMRLDGILRDQQRVLPDDYPLERIVVPTLIVHAEDDTLVPPTNALRSADIPGAELLLLPDGGHFLMGHHDALRRSIGDFVTRHR